MTSTELLIDALGRVRTVVRSVLEDVPARALTFRADPEANTIAWLIWHLTRVQDEQIATLMGRDQMWSSGGWADRFDLPFDPAATGYGQGAHDVGAVRADAGLLAGYYEAVHARTEAYVRDLTDADLAEVVDATWNPPVTRAVRLVSTVSDDLQHAGQAAYVRGLARRAGS